MYDIAWDFLVALEAKRRISGLGLPRDADEWGRNTATAGLLHKCIHDLEELDSGSEIDKEQLLDLRVLWSQDLFTDFALTCNVLACLK